MLFPGEEGTKNGVSKATKKLPHCVAHFSLSKTRRCCLLNCSDASEPAPSQTKLEARSKYNVRLATPTISTACFDIFSWWPIILHDFGQLEEDTSTRKVKLAPESQLLGGTVC
jgi:hypothetical protein